MNKSGGTVAGRYDALLTKELNIDGAYMTAG
jgi:hypothetical protein